MDPKPVYHIDQKHSQLVPCVALVVRYLEAETWRPTFSHGLRSHSVLVLVEPTHQ